MVFNNKSFFLTLDGEAAPAKIDLPTEQIETEESQATPHQPSAPTLLVAPSDQSGAAPSAPAPVTAAVSTPVPATVSAPIAAATPNDVSVAKDNQSATAEATEPKSGGITTAEAMAAELAEAEAARPEMTYSTYAPDNLVPGSALGNQRKRAPGAAVKSFRNMAEDLFKS